jgi:hypothetical protein
MKKRLLTTSWLMLLASFFAIASMAQTVTVQVDNAGGLWDALEVQGITDFTTVKNLTVTGEMGNNDFLLIKNQMSNLESLDIYDTKVTVVPEKAFYNKEQLKTVRLPKGITNIKNEAFSYCQQLESVTFGSQTAVKGKIVFPSSLRNIEYNAFYNCQKLTHLDFSACYSLEYIYSSAFYNLYYLKEVIFPSQGNLRIDWNCFNVDQIWDEDTQQWTYKGLENLTLTKAVTYLSGYCLPRTLKTLYVESSTPPECAEETFNQFTESNISLNIYVPKGSKRSYAIANGWSTLYQYMEEMGILINISGYGSVQQGSRTYSNGDVIFSNQSSATTLKAVPQMGCELISVKLNGNAINVPDGIFTIPEGTMDGTLDIAFTTNPFTINNSNGGELRDLIIASGSNPSTLSVLKVKGKITTNDWNFIKGSLPMLEVFDISETDVKTIPEDALRERKMLTTVHLPSSVTAIGNNAFWDCQQLTKIDGCENVKNIGSSAFYNCNKLSVFPFGDVLEEIESDAFYNCSSLPTTLEMPASLTSLGWTTVFNGSSVHSFDLSKCTLTRDIGNNAFGECTSLALPEKGSYSLSCNALKDAHLTELHLPSAVNGLDCDNVLPTMLERLYVSRTEPIGVSNEALKNLDLANCTLYVPMGSADSYKIASGWSGFTNIKECGFKVKTDGHGLISYDGKTYRNGSTFIPPLGADITLQVIPDVGYDIASLTLNGVAIDVANDGTFTIPSTYSGGTVEVTFTNKQLEIDITMEGSGSYTIDGKTYTATTTLAKNGGDVVKMQLQPATGSFVKQVTINGEDVILKNGGLELSTAALATNTNIAIAFSNDATSIATVTFQQEGFGTVSFDGINFEDGSTLTLVKGKSVKLNFVPTSEATLQSFLVGNANVTSSINDNTYTLSNITTNTTVTTTFFSPNMITVDNPNGGELKDIIAALGSNARTIRALKVTGKMMTKDWNYVRTMSSLEEFDISETDVKVIPEQTFQSHQKLTTVHLPSTVISISNSAFYDCQQLTIIDGCDHIKEIGSSAFGYCRQLTAFPFGNEIRSIESDAFIGCTSLPETLVMPASLNTLGWTNVFNGSSIQSFDLSQCTLTGQFAYNTFGKCTSLLLPEKGDYQMAYEALKDAELTELRLPSAISYIYGEKVLPTTLERLYVSRSTPFDVNDNSSFNNIDFDHCTLYVPKGSVDAYAEAPRWSEFTKVKEYGMTVVVSEQGKVRADAQTLMGSTNFFPKWSTATFEIIPNAGWHADAVTLDGVEIPFANNQFTLSGDQLSGKLTVAFAVNQFNLQLQIAGNGKVKLGSLEYTANQTLTVDSLATLNLTLVPAEGQVVSAIAFNGQESVVQNGGTTYVTPAITANSTLAITFGTAGAEGDVVTYTVSTGEGGTVEYKNTTLLSETTIQLPKGLDAVFAMKPDQYYVVDVVKLNDQDVTSELDADGKLTMKAVNSDAKLEVTFRVNAEITIAMEDGGNLSNILSDTQKQKVTKLIVKGPIWDQDFYTMRDEMPQLTEIDLWEAETEYIPYSAFCTNQNWETSVGKKTLVSIRLPERTRYISDWAFAGCINLKEVNFTELKNLESMSSCAFGWTSLNNINLSQTKLTSLGNEFYKVKGLENVILPKTITYLGETFRESTLTEIDLSGCTNLKTLESTFSDCKELVKVTLPEGLTTINYAFNNCEKLTSINLPKSLLSIGSSAFYNTKLQKVDLSGLTDLQNIGSSAFSNCNELEEVVFPASLQTIESWAFYSCSKLISVDLSKTQIERITDYSFHWCQSLESVKMPKTLKTIGSYAFASNEKLGGVLELGSDFTNISDWAFSGTQISVIRSEAIVPPTLNENSMPDAWVAAFVPEGYAEIYKETAIWEDRIILDKEVHADVTVSNEGNLAIDINQQVGVAPATITHLKVHGPLGVADFDILRENMTVLYDLDMSDAQVSVIPEKAFNSTKKKVLMNVKLPASLLRIEQYAFYGCSGLNGSLTLPEGLKFIGESAFQGCSSLDEVVLNENLEVIQKEAFEGCSSLAQEITLPRDFQSLGERAFANCSSLYGTVKFNRDFYMFMGSEGYDSSAGYCFENCSKIETVDMSEPDFLDEIPYGTFSGCTSLKTILLPPNLNRIYYNAFENCSSLDNIEFPNTLLVIHWGAFQNCTSLSSINLSDCKNLGTIEGYAFNGCSNLETAYLPKSLDWIGEYAFADCRKLANLTVEALQPADLGEYVFRHVHTDRCVLSIPTGTFFDYLSAAQWGEFVSMRKNIDVTVGEGANLYFLNNEPAMARGARRAPAAGQQGAKVKDGSSLYVQENESAIFMVNPDENVQITKVLFNGVDVTSQMVNGTYETPGVTDASSFEVQVNVVGDIHVKELRMLDADVAVKVGENRQLKFAVYPTNATNKAIEWTVSDESVATVNSDGIITGVAPGRAEITGKTIDGDFEEKCQIVIMSNNYWIVMDNSVEGFVDNSISLPLALHNEGEARDIQFDIYLPEGVDMNEWYDGNGNFGIQTSGRADGHRVSAARTSDGAVRVIVYSLDGNQFQDSDGELLFLPFTTGENVGNFDVAIKNIHISGPDNFDFAAPNHTIHFNLKDYPLGDSNGNGEVTTGDAVVTVDYILEQLYYDRFIKKAADVNKDDIITVTDVTGIVDIILERPFLGRSVIRKNSDNAQGRLYMDDISMKAGEQQTIGMQIENAADFIAFQCDVYLPTGMEVARNENGKALVSLAGGVTSDHVISANTLENGALRIVVISPQNETLSVLENDIVNLTVTTDDMMTGDNVIDIRDIRLVRSSDRSEYLAPDASAFVHLSEPTAIDKILATKGMKMRVEGHYVIINAESATVLPLVSTSGISRNLQIHAGENRFFIENAGVYIVSGKKLFIK